MINKKEEWIGVRMDTEMKEKLLKIAEVKKISLAETVRIILEDYLA